MKSKRSVKISLVLIASLYVTSCQTQTSASRNIYSNLEDCQEDWGDINKCEEIVDNSYPMGYYYGPYYRHMNSRIYYYSSIHSSPQLVPIYAGIWKTPSYSSNRSVGKITRSGFGSSASSISKGG